MSGRDLSDPAVVREIAARMGTVERLKLLTLMTWADISAVNPTAMTPLAPSGAVETIQAAGRRAHRELSTRLAQPETQGSPELRAFLEDCHPAICAYTARAEIQEHLRLDSEGKDKGIAVSLIRSEVWTLNVVANDRPFLFASVAAAISSLGFNILKAEAFSNAREKSSTPSRLPKSIARWT